MREGRKRIGLFAGTTEGRILAEWLGKAGDSRVQADVFVATEYGKEGISEFRNLNIRCGRLDENGILEVLLERKYDLVLDATHPFARVVSENIKEACRSAGIRLVRVLREPGDAGQGSKAENGMEPESGWPGEVFVESVGEAVEFLKGTKGNVLVTTGSKELSKYKELPGWEERIYARVLSLPQVVSECGNLGFYGSHLIAMQGPFSEEMNLAMLGSVNARWMVTKESGKAGGFEEKEAAARRAKAGLIIIGRPKEEGVSLEEAIGCLRELLEIGADRSAAGTERLCTTGSEVTCRSDEESGQAGGGKVGLLDVGPNGPKERMVWLIGAGPGSLKFLTKRAETLLAGCDLIAGAGRIVDMVSGFHKPVLREYKPEKIVEFLMEHPEYEKICIVLSGDTGFYSGAKKLREAMKSAGIRTETVPGISSVNYFFAKIGETWENARFLSLHGRDEDPVPAVMEWEKVFFLSGKKETLKEVCRRLAGAGITEAEVVAGENLSLENERILHGKVTDFTDTDVAVLSVILVKNPAARECHGRPLTHGLPDEAFIRDSVPMTKMEVRTVSVSRLMLTADAVVYDVGAGTGSVSAECAMVSAGIKVYAIERNPEAVELLRKNREKFGLFNMEIVEGTAPEAMDGLPAPTHVFIGGSGGRLGEIVEAVLLKNPRARFVVNMITLESVASMMEILKECPVTEPEIIQLTAARAKKAGKSHLMMGQNPVWIMAFHGQPEV